MIKKSILFVISALVLSPNLSFAQTVESTTSSSGITAVGSTTSSSDRTAGGSTLTSSDKTDVYNLVLKAKESDESAGKDCPMVNGCAVCSFSSDNGLMKELCIALVGYGGLGFDPASGKSVCQICNK